MTKITSTTLLMLAIAMANFVSVEAFFPLPRLGHLKIEFGRESRRDLERWPKQSNLRGRK
jgi:hypothetical protein